VETTLIEEKKKKIVDFCNDKHQFIDKGSIDLLEKEERWEEILNEIKDPVVSAEKVKSLLANRESKLSKVKQETVVKKSGFKAIAKEVESDFRIMTEYEVTGQSKSEGKVKDFLNYFSDKYTFLSGLLKNRTGFNPKPLDKLKTAAKYEEVDLIGMVVKKWVSKKENLTIEIDSPEGRCIAIVSKDDQEINREAGKILIDDVIGIKGKKFADEVVIIQSFLWPDLMQRTPKTAERDLSVMLLSDMHIGSKLFMEKEFNKLLSWINGNANTEKELERIGKIKYLVIAGDNVDGVGVYPSQYDELAIKDIYGQYDKFTELVKQIPEHIEIFICPGQHDAVRRADPQPAIPREYVKELHDSGNVNFVGSPSWVEMEGLKAMIYHGASHHDMYSAMSGLDAKKPQNAMIELLRRRDLSTGFGQIQPYVPEKFDYMLIREEPDFYFAGDMHHKGYAQYRGCLNVNAGCWQLRTDYQVKEGHVPTPGIAIDINLKTKKLTENNFYGEGNGNTG
tara:strand:- start:10619 stop:12139 length:1521 start_codon:yes stop_codon:yes gene_type:complete